MVGRPESRSTGLAPRIAIIPFARPITCRTRGVEDSANVMPLQDVPSVYLHDSHSAVAQSCPVRRPNQQPKGPIWTDGCQRSVHHSQKVHQWAWGDTTQDQR